MTGLLDVALSRGLGNICHVSDFSCFQKRGTEQEIISIIRPLANMWGNSYYVPGIVLNVLHE